MKAPSGGGSVRTMTRSTRISIILWLIDAGFILLAWIGLAQLWSVAASALWLPWLIINIVRQLVGFIPIKRQIEPADIPVLGEASDAQLLEANNVLRRSPSFTAGVHGTSWFVAMIAFGLWARFGWAEPLVGRGELVMCLMMAVGVFAGSATGASLTIGRLHQRQHEDLLAEIARRGLEIPLSPLSLTQLMVAFLHALVFSTAALVALPGWLEYVESGRAQQLERLDRALADDLLRVGMGMPPQAAEIVEPAELLPASPAAARDRLPELDRRVAIDRRGSQLSVAAQLANGRWLEARVELEQEGSHCSSSCSWSSRGPR